VDAQGLGLTHPMTWIDERLFGWSRSSRRGTSAWEGHTGYDSSRIGTPDDSDEEDAGDYDNVIGMIPGHDDLSGSSHKSRSRNTSYADLQKLRMQTTTHQQPQGHSLDAAANYTKRAPNLLPSPVTELDGLHFRKGPRNRRPSLSENVPVGRLAEVDRDESFIHATDGLNDELGKHDDQVM
jgi:glycerol-3-phosphate O-acyltransferase / dihydroxyacetone phosphate acyltransferase